MRRRTILKSHVEKEVYWMSVFHTLKKPQTVTLFQFRDDVALARTLVEPNVAYLWMFHEPIKTRHLMAEASPHVEFEVGAL